MSTITDILYNADTCGIPQTQGNFFNYVRGTDEIRVCALGVLVKGDMGNQRFVEKWIARLQDKFPSLFERLTDEEKEYFCLKGMSTSCFCRSHAIAWLNDGCDYSFGEIAQIISHFGWDEEEKNA